MKRRVQVASDVVQVTAVIDGRGLSRREVEIARDQLADSLMRAVAETKYLQTPICRVKVR